MYLHTIYLHGTEAEIAKHDMERANAVASFAPYFTLGMAVFIITIVASFAPKEIVNAALLTLTVATFEIIRSRVVAAKAKRAYEAALSAHESSPRKRNAPTRLLYLLPSNQPKGEFND